MDKLKFIASGILMVCFVVILKAQNNVSYDLSKALKIGDSFVGPDHVLLMRGQLKKVDWNSLKDKVVILDFFSTSCITCIEDMPKLQALQSKYPHIMQIFSVAAQNKTVLTSFFKQNAYLKEHDVNLSVIHSDTSLRKLFPHWAEPHVVLIYKGVVKAITFNRLVTEENILALHRDGSIDLPLKDDFKSGSLSEVNPTYASQQVQSVLLSGYQNGVRAQGLKIEKDSISSYYKSSFYNRSVLIALRNVWNRIERKSYVPRPERIVWKVKDSTEYDSFSESKDSWNVKHAICYERIDRVIRSDSAQAKIILQDIHSLLGIRSYFVQKRMDCLILRSCPVVPYQGREIKDKVGYENTAVLASFIDLGYEYPPVLDRVQGKEMLMIGKYETLSELNAQLKAYGIEAIVGKGELEVMVIEEL